MVLRARAGDEEVVLRINQRDKDRESLTELTLLASASHPGLAKLHSHGSLEGWTWVARQWVEGRPLNEVAGESSLARVGKLIADLTPALAHLHDLGFLHGDLKPDNVLVTAEGAPILTDFGLSLASSNSPPAQTRGVSGSFFALAPEVLLQRAPDARADLFALGVMLHQLLIGKRTSAREFYANFPHIPYFEATGTSSEDLPEWAREITSALLELDPDRRPGSAITAGRALATALGMELEGIRESRPRLVWPRTLGRDHWMEQWVEGVRHDFQRFQRHSGPARSPVRPQRILVPPGENPAEFTAHLSFQAALERIPVRTVDLANDLREVHNTAELDQWARETIATSQDTCLFVHLPHGDQWCERAREMLARTSLQSQSDPLQHSACLLITTVHGHPKLVVDEDTWVLHQVPRASEQHIQHYLEERVLFEEIEELPAFAGKIALESSGACELIQALLDAYILEGWLVQDATRIRARKGIGTARIALEDDQFSPPKLGPEARALASALFVLQEPVTLRDAGELAQLEEAPLAEALRELTRYQLACYDTVRGTLQPTSRALGAPPSLNTNEWRELHARLLEIQSKSKSHNCALRFLAARTDVESVLEQARNHRVSGCPELTIDLVSLLQARVDLVGLTLEPELLGELAAAWIARGDLNRVEHLIAPSRKSTRPRDQAMSAFVEGLLARQKHEFERASTEFARARKLGYRDNGELILSRARLAFEQRQNEELEGLFQELSELPARSIHARIDTDLRNILAMHWFRNGRTQEALDELTQQLKAARARDDAFHEAGVLINLATIERHTGKLEKALEHFEAAEKLYEEAGYLPGLAQTRAQLGASLRDSGRFSEAEPKLSSSLEIRERLGDRQGHAAALGMLGLLHADQGVARAALDELERGERTLAASGRVQDAMLLATRLDEVRIRVNPEARRKMRSASSERDDPRCWIARARTAWMRGDSKSAAEYAQHGLSRGRAANSTRAEEEAQLLLDHMESALQNAEIREVSVKRHVNFTSPVVAMDEETLRLLESPTFDSDRVRMLARTLAGRGRKDRAVRLFWAIRARSRDERLANDSGREGDKLFAEVSRGLTDAERKSLSRHLLAMPDPQPSDLEQRASSVARAGYEDREIELLLEVSKNLVEQANLPTLLGSIVECALTLTGGKRGFIVLEEDGELHFDTAIDSRRGDIAAPEVETSASVIRRSLEAMIPLRLSNAIDDPLLGSSPSVMDLELRSILSCPFVVKDGVRGVIYVDHKLQSGAFDERSERLISHLAHQAAIAIRQVRHLKEIKELNDRLKDRVVTTESDLRTARAALRDAGLAEPTTGLIGNSDTMRRVHELIGRAAPTALPVLIIGASGTGKELAARALHELGTRSDGPFVSENCASLPASLVESEFFGYKRGAFTGAEADRQGMFERADGGTMFLDEIGELSLELQAKLLRVLETGEVRRLGDSKLRTVDFRLLAATNRNLEHCVNEGSFRADLYYRLDALRVDMPPLSERVGDIPELVAHFLQLEEAKTGVKRSLSKKVMAALCRRNWPGNVRELANEVSRLCVLSDGDLRDPELIRLPARVDLHSSSDQPQTLAEIEQQAILQTIERCNGDKDKAAARLGISRAKIYQRLKAWREAEAEQLEA